jgi:hypothetical protein
MQHFNRERVPERVVHAKGSGAHGYFEVTEHVTPWTKAAFLSQVGKRTPVFLRFGVQMKRPPLGTESAASLAIAFVSRAPTSRRLVWRRSRTAGGWSPRLSALRFTRYGIPPGPWTLDRLGLSDPAGRMWCPCPGRVRRTPRSSVVKLSR